MGKLRFRPFPVADWLALDRRSPAPTFFARPAWALAIERCFPNFHPAPLACRLPDGIEAVVPLTLAQGRARWSLYQGMPFDGYTAVLTADGLLPSERAAQVAREVLGAGDEVLLNLWPLQKFAVGGANVRIAAETSALSLGGTLEGALAAISPKSRRMAGQAQRKGAVCAIESGPGSATAYHRLLTEAATERWGRSAPTIEERFLASVVEFGADAVEIWLVRYEGEPVSGGVALYGSREVSLWTTATRPGLEILRPHNLLHASIMERAGARGIEWYNLNSSSGLEGVLRFKKALGATLIPYEIVGRRRPLYRAYRTLRRSFRSAS
ncbi:MAG TPA: GNAT family N-acetyltransferase [Candidatus Acidoferrales bacterium]|nr:GNAT family N-acetyltransferase [Candidatus Acidoferrales bacterium]